jgi:uncharacterized protein (TIGR02145 family)
MFLMLPSCQKDELNQNSILNMDNILPSAISKSSSISFTSLYYSPETFTLSSEGSLIASRVIEKDYFENLENSLVLKVQNGSNNATKVSTIEIKINGSLIITSSDFKKVSLVEKKLFKLTNPAQLELNIEGLEGSNIELWIEGTNKFGIIKDVEGNAYKTVKIGDHWWMAENLKVTKYNDGLDIPFVSDELLWTNLINPGYCWWNNDIENKATYGALYNWYTVSTNKLCPKGWHVSSDAEWRSLISYLGGEYKFGVKIKETGTVHWWSPNAGTNESGFTALPGSFRYYEGPFGGIGYIGYWWTSTEYDAEWATYNFLDLSNGPGYSFWYNKKCGFSVRCVKDY